MSDVGSPFEDSRIGTDRYTGAILKGWAHCKQSIHVILTTRKFLRVMRLLFGSNVPELLDKPGNPSTIARVYYEIYVALRDWEPGFRVTKFQLVSATKAGGFVFDLTGVFYPRGHLGDYSISSAKSITVAIGL